MRSYHCKPQLQRPTSKVGAVAHRLHCRHVACRLKGKEAAHLSPKPNSNEAWNIPEGLVKRFLVRLQREVQNSQVLGGYLTWVDLAIWNHAGPRQSEVLGVLVLFIRAVGGL